MVSPPTCGLISTFGARQSGWSGGRLGSIGARAVAGPLVVESYDSTVVVPPDAAVASDAFGNLVITRG